MIVQVIFLSCIGILGGVADDMLKNHHPHHRNSLMTMKDLTDHWIGMPKSPYVHYTATVSSTTASVPSPTSPPMTTPKKTTKTKPKKRKKTKLSNKRRFDDDDPPQYRSNDYRDKNPYSSDFDYDYDSFNNPSYGRPTSPNPYVMKSSSSSPQTVYVNPSGSSPSVSAIFAGVPKIATYVVPSAKKYIVQRVNSHAMFIPPASSVNSKMYPSASESGMRRQDPMDYDDGNFGSDLGPQNGFPPRPVMNKITEPGGRQPCHGPECHQHHKGLVRFYWRRVVYPEGSRRGRGRRRPQRFRNRRRFRDRDRLPSDQKEFYATEDDEDEEEEAADSENVEEDDEEIDEDSEEDGDSTKRKNRWRPKGYGHNLHEGDNYDEGDKRVYRDKRYTYNRSGRRPYK